MVNESNKFCPFAELERYCIKECALYSEEYEGCCIANFGEEMLKVLIRALEISRMTRRN